MRRYDFLAASGVVALLGAEPRERRNVLHMVAAPIGQSMDPYANGRSGIDELSWLYGDGLVGWNGTGAAPLLAAAPSASGDGLQYRYRLRPAIWHDGSQVRAGDVKVAWEQVKQTSWHLSLPYSAVRDVVPIDERDFVVKLDAPVRGFVRSFFGPYGTPALPLLRPSQSGPPIGTGPFVLRAHADPGRWKLERWHASPRGRPRLDAIDLRLVPVDSTVAIQLQSGEADIAYPLPSRTQYRWLERFAVQRRVTSIVFFVFNTEGILNSPAMRRTFVKSIDLQRLQRGFDSDLTALFTSYTMTGWTDDAFARLLDSSAAIRTFRDAIRERPLRVVYMSGKQAYARVANGLQQDLGGETFVQTEQFPIAVLLAPEGPLWKGAFDVAIIGLPYGDDPDLAPAWGCANRSPHGANISRWCDGAFEAALARHDVGAALHRLVEALVCVPLGPAREDIGIDSRVRNFRAPPPLVPLTYACTDWELAY